MFDQMVLAREAIAIFPRAIFNWAVLKHRIVHAGLVTFQVGGAGERLATIFAGKRFDRSIRSLLDPTVFLVLISEEGEGRTGGGLEEERNEVSYLEDVSGGEPLTPGDNPRMNDSSPGAHRRGGDEGDEDGDDDDDGIDVEKNAPDGS